MGGALLVGVLCLIAIGCNGDDGFKISGTPLAFDDTATTNEDTPVTIAVLSNDVDPDGGTLTVIGVLQPANGRAVINAGSTITYTPNLSFSGTDTFAYTIRNAGGVTNSAEVTVSVTAVADRLATPSRSTTIALTSNDRVLVSANLETNSVSVLEVRTDTGVDASRLLAEIPVGQEPRCVAISPDDLEVYVTNTASGTVSLIPLGGPDAFRVVAEIPVGTEPRGCAITPNGTRLFVANHTSGTVSIIDLVSRTVVSTVTLGGNPTAVAITNDNDGEDTDERVFVTQFFAELLPGGPGEGFDNGKRGIVHTFTVGSPSTITRIPLSPLSAVGFTANRSAFCPQTSANPSALHSTIFCPDLSAAAGSTVITQDPQGAFPNQLFSALIRGNRLFLPNIGAGPEPPVAFSVNVQALVHVTDTTTLAERTDLHLNLNEQIRTETQPTSPTTSLGRLFGNDVVAIDANPAGTDFLIVSRGGNYVMRAGVDANGRLSLGAPNVVRFQTGNLPNGVVISRDGRRAYVNNEVNVSVTAIDLSTSTVLARDIDTGSPPVPGTFEHAVLLGKLAFFTALGIPEDGIFFTPIRDINPLSQRGKASDNAWSGCGSCHPDGLSDGVTWIFPTGPRQTVALDAFFAKDNPADQRISNWNAVRGSITDFNNNSRVVQGGIGFAGSPPNPNIYNHGITQGASDALDVQTLWVQTIRAPLMPPAADTAAQSRGETTFSSRCASCHGGAKWTKSQVVYRDNPAFTRDAGAGGVPTDPGVTSPAGGQIQSYTVGGVSITFIENVGTFTTANPLEIRGVGGAIGQTGLGGIGFNVPSLLGIGYHAPYLHHGAAQTLSDVFSVHTLGTGTIATTLTAAELADLTVFLRTIDGKTGTFRSQTDDFRDAVALP